MIPAIVANRVANRVARTAAGLALRVLLVAGVCGLAAAGGTPVPSHPQPTSHSAAECADLVKQYDVAAPAHHGAARADEAARARDAGVRACQEGRYADGVSSLRRALHDIGVSPVRYSPPTTP